MRTTLTLDDDVAKEIEKLRRQRGTKWKVLVNEALPMVFGVLQPSADHPAARRGIPRYAGVNPGV